MTAADCCARFLRRPEVNRESLFAPLDVDFARAGFELKTNADTDTDTDVHVVRNEIAPNGHSGWHTHPGPSLVTVAVGEVIVYDADDPLGAPKRFTVGQGFIDLAAATSI